MKQAPLNTVEAAKRYIHDVQKGNIVVCKYIKLAVKRHVNDLKTAHQNGFYFDEKAAAKALWFFDFLKHSKGRYAGTPFILDDWQAFAVYSLYGWKKQDGFRRYTEAYIQIAKKNGKTTLSSGLSLLSLVFDNEAGAEVYAAAYTREQASICFEESEAMVKASPDLMKRIKLRTHQLSVPKTRSKFQAVSHEAKNTEGKNAHFVSFDEYHVHKSNKVKESLRSGQAARMQPLFFIITTAGDDPSVPCYKYYQESVKILEGQIKRENQFVMIFTLDEKDQWDDPTVWIKANPGLGRAVNTEFIAQEISTAKTSITSEKEADVKTKHLDIWVASGKRWINDETWCGLPKFSAKEGETCYGGLDLAAVSDFAAFSLLFPPTPTRNEFGLIPFMFLPRRTFDARVKAGFVDLVEWERLGHLIVTEKKTIDYEVVKRVILESAQQYDLQFVGYDRWNSSQLINELTEILGTRSVQKDGKSDEYDIMDAYGQGYSSMSTPMKELETLILNDRFSHDHNPLFRWMLGNVMVKSDEAENVKPDKKNSSEKIDGPVSAIMAIGQFLTWNWGEEQENPYDERGFVEL